MTKNDIHPDFNIGVSREKQEKLLGQKSKVFWFTGLSGSGKSTLAGALANALYEKGFYTGILDGDNVRHGLNADLGFSMEDRKENIRRVAEISKLFCQNGTIVLSTFISPTIESRECAKNIIGSEDFVEVYINTPLEVCEDRDVKGLYKKARAGDIKDFSGIDSPYEAPENPDLVLETEGLELTEVLDKLLTFALQKIK